MFSSTGGGGFLGSSEVEKFKEAGAVRYPFRAKDYDLTDRGAIERVYDDALRC
ncbi:MAG: hypothetical protein IPN96_16490 [Anaerolineales bacterium]|nr:hypothetical protein [Anaerolineales bacterium]